MPAKPKKNCKHCGDQSRCFGMTGNPNMTPAAKSNKDWQQGFGVVYYDDTGLLEFRHIPIFGHQPFRKPR